MFVDWPASMQMKNEPRWKLIIALRWLLQLLSAWIQTSTCMNKIVLQPVCPLNDCCKAESDCYYTGYQWSCTKHSKNVKIGCLTSHILAHRECPDTFVNVMASTQKEDSVITAQAWFFASSFFELPGSHVGHSDQLKRVWSMCHMFAMRKWNSLWNVWRHYIKISHHLKFPAIQYPFLYSHTHKWMCMSISIFFNSML